VPDGWKKERASKLFNIQGGFAFKSTDAIQNSKGIRWLKIANVGLGNIKWDEQSYLPVDYLQKHSNFCLNVGDIVVAMTRPLLSSVLKIAQLSKNDAPSLLNQRVGRIIPKKYVIKEFLFHIFKTKHLAYELESDLLGTDPPNLSIKTFKNIFFLLPPLLEQKAIADLLSTWDKAIEKTERLILAKEKRFKALLRQLISDNGQLTTENSSADDADSRRWKKVKLGDVCKVNMGSSPPSKAYNKKGLGLPLLQGKADLKDRKSKPRIYTIDVTKTCEIGDLLLSVRAPVGYISKAEHKCCIGRGIAAFRVSNKFNADFVYFQLLLIEQKWASVSQGGTFEAVSGIEVKNFTLKIPSLTKQKQIAETLSTAQWEIELLKQLAEKYKTQKRGLMQKLLTGDWRIKPEILNKYRGA